MNPSDSLKKFSIIICSKSKQNFSIVARTVKPQHNKNQKKRQQHAIGDIHPKWTQVKWMGVWVDEKCVQIYSEQCSQFPGRLMQQIDAIGIYNEWHEYIYVRANKQTLPMPINMNFSYIQFRIIFFPFDQTIDIQNSEKSQSVQRIKCNLNHLLS